jgi:hypothetical protein
MKKSKLEIRDLAYTDVEWDKGNCRNGKVSTRLFYPPNEDRISSMSALSVCSDCQIKLDCLGYAVYHEPYGVWGGATPKQRARLYPIRIDRRSRYQNPLAFYFDNKPRE